MHPRGTGPGRRVDGQDPRPLAGLGALQVEAGERRAGSPAGGREDEHHQQDAEAGDRSPEQCADHASSSTTRNRCGVSIPDSRFIQKNPPAKHATTTSRTTWPVGLS